MQPALKEMKTVTVVGAGFSGLVTAYYLVKKGFKVRIREKCARPGGLLGTIRTEHGLIETAANGIQNSARLEAISADVGVPLLPTRHEAKARFIYKGKPRRWPLEISDTLKLGINLASSATQLKPRPFETIAEWGERVIGHRATEYLLAPALNGIYAGDPKRLSASLIFRRALLPKHLKVKPGPRSKHRGTMAPPKGLQQLTDGLHNLLLRNGVEFAFNHNGQIERDEPIVLCTSARAAAECLIDVAPEVASCLRNIEMLPLLTVTCFYNQDANHLNGFGCLFPPREGFRARGVLLNTCIFEGRGPAHSETWIFGGALDPDVINLTTSEVSELISSERYRMYGRMDRPLAVYPTAWRAALPHYSIETERVLVNLPPLPNNIALVGNYLGGIGLAKIIDRAAEVAEQLGTQPAR